MERCFFQNYNRIEEEPYFLANLNAGFIVLSHIFQYLNLKDLQSAACVCKTWNYVASSKSLWKTIRLEDLKVKNWSAFRKALLRNETEELDLWEMVIPDDLDKEALMWKKMSRAVKNLKSLKKLDMGRCPPEALVMMVKVTPRLTSLVSLDVQDGDLDLVKVCKLKELTELKLNSFSKRLELRNFEYLKDLKNLETLSVTEVVSLTGIENSLPNGLITLELGPWHSLSTEMSKTTLPTLKNLRKLRMEQAWDATLDEMRPFFETVPTMPHLVHLELVNFPAIPGFDNLIAKLTNIETFHYLMNVRIMNSAVMNYIFMDGISKLSGTLKRLVWELPRDLEYTDKDSKKLSIVPLQVADSGYVDFLGPNDFWWNIRALLPRTEIEFVNLTVSPTYRHTVQV